MPRPTRIEYPNAFYHIMNRGRGRQNIFHSHKYFLSFLDCLFEVNQRFGAVIHAYCLMTNHYHLILETPHGNLSRVMQHINGIYTQRYNRLKKTDGPLFRGRFRAILIDKDNYLLNLNKYIHRNPIKLVEKLEDYKWSSYPEYLGLSPVPKWLNKEKTLEKITASKNLKSYKSYVEESENDNVIEEFYTKKNLPAVMGDDNFKKKLYERVVVLDSKNKDQIKNNLNDHITAEKIIKSVAKIFKVKEDFIIKKQIIRSKNNIPRKISMYLCQTYTQNSLSKTQRNFNLESHGTVSCILTSIRKELKMGKYQKELSEIKNDLFII
jgi:REP element-mobilizing transposase RayT